MSTSPDTPEEIEEKADPAQFEAHKEQLRARCKTAGIATEDITDFDETVDFLALQMPAGRERLRLIIADEDEAGALLSINFEKYCMLGDYAGICSYSDGTIEASIRPLGMAGPPMSYLARRLFGSEDGDFENAKPIIFQQPNAEKPLSITLGPPSPDFMVFDNIHEGGRARLSIRIENSNVHAHDKALRTLERLAHSLFFQIDLQMGIPLTLVRERSRRRLIRGRLPAGKKEDLKYPEREYDFPAMSLYWYAKSATGMPLLQFLAFYQVLEFYMPTCSNHEAISKVRNILKDPRFNLDKDPQIARVLAALRISARGFGDERSQLEAVLRRCISPEELRQFIEADDARVKYYETDFKSIVPQKIPINNPASDLLTETAHRLYEIRCRIVHTKEQADRELPPLLPYSKETNDLYTDNTLMEFIATAVLVSSSTTMSE